MKVTTLTKLIISTDYSQEWAYTYHQDMMYHVEGHTLKDCEAYFDNKKLLTVSENTITIHKGYSFDGMTCYPDDSANLAWAGLHDALYQTRIVQRKVADDMLRSGLRSHGKKDRYLVHLGVRLFGWLCYKKSPHIRIKYL